MKQGNFVFERKLTRAFEEYRKTSDDKAWEHQGSTVFEVVVTDKDNKVPPKAFFIDGYTILNGVGDFTIDFQTADMDELWKSVLQSDILNKYL